MNTGQLLKCVKQDEMLHRYCTGIYASDTIPYEIKSLPTCFIMNTDPIALPGDHWVAIYISTYGQHEFFDSYGRRQRMVAPHLKKIAVVGSSSSDWIENNVELQARGTSTCGQYCLYYLSARCAGWHMSEIVNKFLYTQDPIENDILINDYVNSTYNTELDVYDEKIVKMQIATPFY